jgi:hypothetical protein
MHGQNLTKLHLNFGASISTTSLSHVIQHCYSLKSLVLSVPSFDMKKFVGYPLIHAKSVTLLGDILMVCAVVDFCSNLECLSVHISNKTIEGRDVISILSSCPKLKSLTMVSSRCHILWNHGDKETLAALPELELERLVVDVVSDEEFLSAIFLKCRNLRDTLVLGKKRLIMGSSGVNNSNYRTTFDEQDSYT